MLTSSSSTISRSATPLSTHRHPSPLCSSSAHRWRSFVFLQFRGFPHAERARQPPPRSSPVPITHVHKVNNQLQPDVLVYIHYHYVSCLIYLNPSALLISPTSPTHSQGLQTTAFFPLVPRILSSYSFPLSLANFLKAKIRPSGDFHFK